MKVTAWSNAEGFVPDVTVTVVEAWLIVSVRVAAVLGAKLVSPL